MSIPAAPASLPPALPSSESARPRPASRPLPPPARIAAPRIGRGDEDDPIQTEALIIGAGPVGLFQVFALGLLEIRACVLDALPEAGGQCTELYPDKPIYDIPALPFCSGRELIDRLLEQAAPFAPHFDLGARVSIVRREADQRWRVVNDAGRHYLARTVFIAAGAGAFEPQVLPVPGIEQFEGRQLFYRVRDREALRGRRVLVCGGGDSALDWAIDLCDIAASVTLIHRRDKFRATPASVSRMRALQAEGRLGLTIAHPVDFTTEAVEPTDAAEGGPADGGDGADRPATRLSGLVVEDAQGGRQTLGCDVVLAFFGLAPKLGPIAEWGLEIEGRQLPVDTERFETREPGLFAVGDINTYPGKRKLILSGFHEATLAAYGATRLVFPERRVLLQYTTTSTRLHQVLGVTVPDEG